MAQALSQDTNVVLKLQTTGGTRRIVFRKLWDPTTSTVSFARLTDLACEYHASTNGKSLEARVTDYKVVVTYTDEDGDMIRISTDEELAEAFGQFVGKVPPVLRASAFVRLNAELKKKASVGKLRDAVVGLKESTQQAANAKSLTSSDFPTDASFGPAKLVQLNAVLETFVSVLANAVESLQGQISRHTEPRDPLVTPLNTQDSRAIASITATASSPDLPVTPTAQNDAKETDVKEEAKKPEPVSPSETRPVESAIPKETLVAEQPEAKNDDFAAKAPDGFDPEFIHGRHTCDGCLCTPIIGVRYHATNLPDYDLCQNCVHNYKGNDITFEPAQLERDVRQQMRWRRRQFRRTRHAEPRFGGSYPGSCRSGGGGWRQHLKAAVEEGDAALKEAIRRSLLDANQKRVVPNKPATDIPSDTAGDLKSDESKTELQPVSAPSVNVEVPLEVAALPAGNVIVEEIVSPAKSVVEEIVSPVKNVVEESSALIKKVIVEDASEVPAPEITSSAEVISPPKPVVFETSVVNNSASEVKSVVSDVIVKIESLSEEETAPESITIPSSSETSVSKIHKSRNLDRDSFSADAEGHGDVAIAIGETLDDCAKAFDTVVSEIENSLLISSVISIDSEPESISSAVATNETNPKPSGKSLEGFEVATDAGQTILESVTAPAPDSDDESSNTSSDEWQFLDDDGQIAHDEMIARAAELIGSALFQSDMGRSAGTTLTPGSNFPTSTARLCDSSVSSSYASAAGSSVSSVPSSVPSITSNASSSVSAVLLSRWDSELRQLHELGFLDDRSNLDALERLEAANLGVDSTDPVRLDDVVNYLLGSSK